jgi:hypothetical protein
MKSLVLMYIFYDSNGDIKAITPTSDESFSATFSVATFPLAEVDVFLNGQENTFNYQVKCIERETGNIYKLVKKQLVINYTRSLDSYLTKIDSNLSRIGIITVVNNIKDKTISLKLNETFKDQDDEEINNFKKQKPSTLYLTKKNNPYWLLFSITFTPAELFERGILYFNYEDDYSNISIYTKKLINGYVYTEKV